MKSRMLLRHCLKSPGAVLSCVLCKSCCFTSSILHLGPFWSSENPPVCIAMATSYPHLSWRISEVQESEKNWNDTQVKSVLFFQHQHCKWKKKCLLFRKCIFGAVRCSFARELILPYNYFSQTRLLNSYSVVISWKHIQDFIISTWN